MDDAAAALQRLAAEEEDLGDDAKASPRRSSRRASDWPNLKEILFDSEAALGAPNPRLADRTPAGPRPSGRGDADERIARLTREAERVGRDFAALDASLGGDVDLASLEAEMEQVANTYAEAEERAQSARAAHAAQPGRPPTGSRAPPGGRSPRPAPGDRGAGTLEKLLGPAAARSGREPSTD